MNKENKDPKEELDLENEATPEVEEVIEEVSELDLLKEENKVLIEKRLELIADKENLVKRLEKEKSDIIKYSSSSFLNKLIPSLDMMEQALASKEVSDEIKNWLMGFTMINNNIISSLKEEGITIIEPQPGDYYDPNMHHAIEEQESEDFEDGKIIKAYNKIYLLHDRLLRPANVVVSKKITKDKIKEAKTSKGENNG